MGMFTELGPDIFVEAAACDVRVWGDEAGAAIQALEAGEGVGPSGEGADGDAAGVLDQERCAASSSGVDDAKRRLVAFMAADELADVGHRLRSRRRSRALRHGCRR